MGDQQLKTAYLPTGAHHRATTGSEPEDSPVSCEADQSREVIRESEQVESEVHLRGVNQTSYIQETCCSLHMVVREYRVYV